MQRIVPVYDTDTVDSLSDRVLYEAEFVVYPEALQALAERRVEFVEERGVFRVRVNEPKQSNASDAVDDL